MSAIQNLSTTVKYKDKYITLDETISLLNIYLHEYLF